MRVEFNAKYGINEVDLSTVNGVNLVLRFTLKYGKNVISIPTTKKVLFYVVKYGKNVLEIPEDVKTLAFGSDLYKNKVTIYNDVPSDGVNPRRFYRSVVELCNIQKGTLQNADGTIEKVVNATTVITRDITHYVPFFEFVYLPEDKKQQYFTANVNDFVVMAEVDDVVTTGKEFQNLQTKYKDVGFSVTAVNEYINGMSVDNIQLIHA